MLEKFSTVRKYRAPEHAIELLMKAEQTGKRADIKAATDQISIVLRHRQLMGP